MTPQPAATSAAGRALLEELVYWGKDEYLARLAAYPEPVREEVLRQAAAIWPVSYSLGYNFLDRVERGLACLPLDKLAEWVNATLDVYEVEGLRAATRYLDEVQDNFLCRLHGEHGLSLAAASGRLLPYVRGLAGAGLNLAPATSSWTDGETIYLPPEITLCKQSADNFIVYKLLASCQWGLLKLGSLDFHLDVHLDFHLDPGVPLVKELTELYGRRPADLPFPDNFSALFPVPALAADLFLLLESRRVLLFLQQQLPGLMRDSLPVRRLLPSRRSAPGRLAGPARLVEAWGQWVLAGRSGEGLRTTEQELYRQGLAILKRAGGGEVTVEGKEVIAEGKEIASMGKEVAAGGEEITIGGEKMAAVVAGVESSLAATAQLYGLLAGFYELAGTAAAYDGAAYDSIEPLLGVLRPAAYQAVRQRQRQERRQRFIEALGAILPLAVKTPPAAEEDAAAEEDETGSTGGPAVPPESQGLALLSTGRGRGEEDDEDGEDGEEATADDGPEYLVIGGREFQLPEEVRQLAREIREDLGRVPQQYLSAAVGLAGTAPVRGPGPAGAAGDEEALPGPLVYDEWDYRRQGFRKNWCKLLEKELAPVQSRFVAATLAKYRGPLQQLRRQFEMMRLQQRYLKRQREGDEIDFDAAVEAMADHRAGVSPSENLFIRLDRDERNIAAVFLVDMSSSTEGWISTALKESLTLMCEALQVLGDRYAIYGFSGMRRQRAEFYHVKHLDEPYNDLVRGRLAAINPREYTRMGPPIRHVTRLLAGTEARVRLLIILSDGKPEDYDDYKGDYAIEDTRHALIEARAAGVHPFCITIDHQAHDYIPHMFGAVSYCFIDEVRKLPLRLPGIYRALTT